jgi:hypothetical protein
MKYFSRVTFFAFLLHAGLAWAVVGKAGAVDRLVPTAEFEVAYAVTRGKRTARITMFFTPQKIRLEIDIVGKSIVSIVDRIKRQHLLILPEKKQYVVQPIGDRALERINQFGGKWTSLKKVGEETILDNKTTMYQAVGELPGKSIFAGHIWVTKENILLRMIGRSRNARGESNSRVEATRVSIGPVPPGMFVVPEGYVDARKIKR